MAVRPATSVDSGFWADRTTIAALLFKVMPVDGEIHESERIRLNRILADEFSIDEVEVVALVQEAHAMATKTEDLAVLSRKLKTSLPHKAKLKLVSHMWELVLADGKLHEYELLLMERVADLLGITPEDVASMMERQD